MCGCVCAQDQPNKTLCLRTEINQIKYYVCTILFELPRWHTRTHTNSADNDYMAAEKSRIPCNEIGEV